MELLMTTAFELGELTARVKIAEEQKLPPIAGAAVTAGKAITSPLGAMQAVTGPAVAAAKDYASGKKHKNPSGYETFENLTNSAPQHQLAQTISQRKNEHEPIAISAAQQQYNKDVAARKIDPKNVKFNTLYYSDFLLNNPMPALTAREAVQSGYVPQDIPKNPTFESRVFSPSRWPHNQSTENVELRQPNKSVRYVAPNIQLDNPVSAYDRFQALSPGPRAALDTVSKFPTAQRFVTGVNDAYNAWQYPQQPPTPTRATIDTMMQQVGQRGGNFNRENLDDAARVMRNFNRPSLDHPYFPLTKDPSTGRSREGNAALDKYFTGPDALELRKSYMQQRNPNLQ
jgi:hypothetical protein